MSNDNVVDLQKHFALDARTHGFFNAIKAIAATLDILGNVVGMMAKSDQRFLCQIIAWRLEGASLLPATQGLTSMPLLVGMGFDEIQMAAERLVAAGVIETAIIPGGMGFRWPQLEAILEQGKEIAAGPKLTGLDGRPLTKK